jgi:mevalonate kinase
VEGSTPVLVSAPGKLILMGEHAVVYGRPALVAAIDRRLTARLTSVPAGGVHLLLTQLAHTEELPWEEVLAYARDARRRWQQYAEAPGAATFQALRGDDPAHVVKVALGEAAAALGEVAPPHLALSITSELPIGSGFGSSAATAVAVVAGYLAFRGAALEPERVLGLALEAERRQHGMPSGVDGATVFQGGILWARRGAGGALEREAVAARSPLLSALRVYDTGTPPEPTGAVVAAVRERWHHDPHGVEGELERIAAATRAFRAVLESAREDPPAAVALIREAEARLEALGVVPAAVRELVRRVEAEGGAAKISGAGSLRGPAAGSLLVYHADPERLASWPFLRSLSPHPVALGAPGFRREAA